MSNQLKLTVGVLVSEPVYAMQQGRPVIVGYKFQDALRKLADDPMPIKDRYAVGRAAKQVDEVVRLYDKSRYELIGKLGKRQSELLAEELADMKAKFADKSPEMAGAAAHARMKSIEETIQALLDDPAADSSRIPDDDRKALDEFEGELRKLQAEEFELEHLNRLVPLHPDSKLTGNEMAILAEKIVKAPE